jgi:hypothetical protein
MTIEAQALEQENPYEPVRQLLEELIAELSSTDSHALTTSGLEALIHQDGIELMRLLLQAHLDERGLGKATHRVINSDAKELPYQRQRMRWVESLFGRVCLNRVGYEAKGHSIVYPLDANLNLPKEVYSLGVRKRIAMESVKVSYDEALCSLSTTTGAQVPKRQAEELVVRAATDFEQFYQRDSSAEDPPKEVSILVLSTDGKGVVMREQDLRPQTRKAAQSSKRKLESKLSKGEKHGRKRMATVASVYEIAPYRRTPEQVESAIMKRLRLVETQRPRPHNKRVWASLQREPKQVIEEVFAESLRRDPSQQRSWVALVDGNETQLSLLSQQAQTHSVELSIILDLMHVLSYLWKAAYAFWEEGSAEAERWVEQRLVKLLQGKASSVAAGMRCSATAQGLTAPERKPVDKCADYLLKYKQFLRYDSYLAQGYPICSGVIEGTCRHLINDRMDRTGARWRLVGAEAVLQLRSIYASGDFEEYWKFHEACEQQRTHASRYAQATLPTLKKPQQDKVLSSKLPLLA